MIAANFRKYAEAMALQLVLPFGRALVWATSRPTTVALRAIRAARGAAFRAAGRIRYPVKRGPCDWASAVKKRARKLAQMVQKAQQPIVWNDEPEPTGFRAHVAWCRETLDRYTFAISPF